MQVIPLPKNPCPFCKKNEATQLCDFVVDYIWTSFKRPGHGIGKAHVTCNNQICKECSSRFTGYDFCPECEKLRQYVVRNHKQVGKSFAFE